MQTTTDSRETRLPDLFSESDGIDHAPDEMVLVGPPGTGKTTAVLTHFLLPAVERWTSGAILGCSFTRAAAEEMRDRLAAKTSRLSDRELRSVCSTIHSEAFRLCRLAGYKTLWNQQKKKDEGSEQEPDFGGWEAMKEERKERRSEAERLWSLARYLRPQDLVMPPATYDRHGISVLLTRALSRCSERSRFMFDEIVTEVMVYESDKRAAGAIDFCDMLAFALHLPFPDRELLVVDEAQDLSPLQIALIRRWAGGAKRLVWVGDPDQGIYAFAGADGAALTALLEDEIVRSRRLGQSYRVPQAAHEMARDVILRNVHRVDAPYLPMEEPGIVVEFAGPQAALREALAGAGDVFILGRSARVLDDYAQILVETGEPFARERGGGSPLRQKDLISIVTVLNDLRADLSVSTDAALTLVDALKAKPKGLRFTGTKKAAAAALKASGEQGGGMVSRMDMERAGVVTGPIMDHKSLDDCLDEIGLAEAAEPLFRIIRRHGIGALEAKPRVVLTTMHSSKGREADTVLVDLYAPYPTRRTAAISDQDGIEDERRVLYVALTRTRDALLLVRRDWNEDLLRLLG